MLKTCVPYACGMKCVGLVRAQKERQSSMGLKMHPIPSSINSWIGTNFSLYIAGKIYLLHFSGFFCSGQCLRVFSADLKGWWCLVFQNLRSPLEQVLEVFKVYQIQDLVSLSLSLNPDWVCSNTVGLESRPKPLYSSGNTNHSIVAILWWWRTDAFKWRDRSSSAPGRSM